MKLFGKTLVLLTDEQRQALKEIGHDVLEAPISAGQHIVAAFKASPEGKQVLQIMHDLEATGMSGTEKFAKAAGDAVQLVTNFVTSGGHSILVRVEDLAKEAVQSLFNDEFSAAKKAAAVVGDAASNVASQVEGAEPQAEQAVEDEGDKADDVLQLTEPVTSDTGQHTPPPPPPPSAAAQPEPQE